MEAVEEDGEIRKILRSNGENEILLESNFEELSAFFLEHGQPELYPGETIGLIREMFGSNPNIYLGMNNGPQDVEGIMLHGSGYNGIPRIPTEKDFFVALLYLPDPSNQANDGHFVAGVFKKTDNRRQSYELYIFDSNGFKDGVINFGKESYLPDGREINVSASTLNEYHLKMNSDMCPYYTLVTCYILSGFPNFNSLEQYCSEQQQTFAEKGTNDIDQEVINFLSSHGMPPEIFSNFKANGSSFHLPGAAGRANISRLHLDPLKRTRVNTTDNIIKKGNQQTYIERVQQRRKRSNSIPSKH